MKDEVKTEKIVVKTGRSSYTPSRKVPREVEVKNELAKLEHQHKVALAQLQETARRTDRDVLYASLQETKKIHDAKNKRIASMRADLENHRRAALKEHELAVRQLQGARDRAIFEAERAFEAQRDDYERGAVAKNKPVKDALERRQEGIKADLVVATRKAQEDYEAACIPLLQELGEIETEQKERQARSEAKAAAAKAATP